MTWGGGKPHAVGDRGQRYEISYIDPDSDEPKKRRIFGWSDTREGAERMAESITLHPVWTQAEICDRHSSKTDQISHEHQWRQHNCGITDCTFNGNIECVVEGCGAKCEHYRIKTGFDQPIMETSLIVTYECPDCRFHVSVVR